MSNLLEKASILTTPTAYENGKILSVKPSIVLGAELVTNGSFDTDTDWNKDDSWTISGGKANYNYISGRNLNSSTATLIVGRIYQIKYDILDYVSGSVENSSAETPISNNSNGTYTEVFTARYTFLRFRGSTNGEFSIDNVSVKEVTDADFDFTRNSSATRVNAQGVVEDVQILSSNLVSNGDFSQEGAELVTNGDFATDSDWTKQTSWSISGGAANYDFLSDAKYIRQTLLSGGFVAGKAYKISFEITSGTAYMNVSSNGGGLISLNTYSVGSYSIYVIASAGGSDLLIYGRNTSGTAFSIDNVSVKEVGQDWILGTGITIGENKAIFTSTASGQSVSQNAAASALPNGALAKVSFEVLTRTEGSFGVYFSGTLVGTLASAGVFTAYFTKGTETSFYIRALGTTSGSISNISVIEITDDTNLPRIDYTDGVGSWLFEPQSTNLLTYSEDLTQGITNRLLITSNTNSAPDGTNTADKLIPNNTNSAYHYFAFSSLTIATNNVYSVFLKKAEYEYALISFETNGLSGSVDNALINLNNGTIEQSDTETKLEDYGNGWYRCSIKATSSRTSVVIYPLASASLGSFTGDNVSGILAWGLQLEQNSYATSYIPTNGSTVTRLQDAAFGAGSSDLINSTEGVLYAEIAALANDLTNKQISLNNGTTDDRIQLYYSTSSNQISVFYKSQSGATSFILNHTLSDITQFNKVAFKWKQNDFALWSNGVEVATQTSGVTSNTDTLTKLDFLQFNGSADFFGKTKCVAVFKEALTDAELTCLTTI